MFGPMRNGLWQAERCATSRCGSTSVHVHVDEDPDTIVADFKRRASQAPTLRSGKAMYVWTARPLGGPPLVRNAQDTRRTRDGF